MALNDWLSLLLNRLPKFITKATSSYSYRLFNTVARELDFADQDIAYAKLQENIITAEGIALDMHGIDYGILRKVSQNYWGEETRQVYYNDINKFDIHFGNLTVAYNANTALRITQGLVISSTLVLTSTYNSSSDITTVTITDSILTPGDIDKVERDIFISGESDAPYRNRILSSYNRPQLTKPAILSILNPVSFQVPQLEEFISSRWFAMEPPEIISAEEKNSTSISKVPTDYNIAILDGVWLAAETSSSYGYANNATYVNTYVLNSSAYSPTYDFNDSSTITVGTTLPSAVTDLKVSYRTNLLPQAFVGYNTIAQDQAIRLNATALGASAQVKTIKVKDGAFLDEWNEEMAPFNYVSPTSFTIPNGNYLGKYQTGTIVRVTQAGVITETAVSSASAFNPLTNTTTIVVADAVLNSYLSEIEVNGNVVSVGWVGTATNPVTHETGDFFFTWASLIQTLNGTDYFAIKDEYRTDYYWRQKNSSGGWEPIILSNYQDAAIPFIELVFVGMYDPIYKFEVFISEQRLRYGTNVVYGTKRVYGDFLGVRELDPWSLVDTAKVAGTQFTIKVVDPYDYTSYFGIGTYGRIIYGQDSYL